MPRTGNAPPSSRLKCRLLTRRSMLAMAVNSTLASLTIAWTTLRPRCMVTPTANPKYLSSSTPSTLAKILSSHLPVHSNRTSLSRLPPHLLSPMAHSPASTTRRQWGHRSTQLMTSTRPLPPPSRRMSLLLSRSTNPTEACSLSMPTPSIPATSASPLSRHIALRTSQAPCSHRI